MAKKTKFEANDDFGFDDDLDIPDFGSDFGGGKTKSLTDRSPSLGFAKSAITSAASSMKDEYFIRQALKKSLPRGYGEALDLADEATSTLKSLYNDTAKELKPVINDLKKTTKRMMPAADKILPKSISSRLSKWADSADQGRAAFDEEAAKEASMQMELGSIFGTTMGHQLKADAERDAKNDAREEVKMGMDHKRHQNQMGQLDAIRQSVQQLSAYQNKITVNYQRKSLELQYRSFFLQRDQLTETKKFNETMLKGMEAVVRNTALPEFQKITEAESIKQIMRNKFIDALDDSIFSNRRKFLGRIAKGLKTTILGKVGNFAGQVRDMLGQVDFALDAQDSMKEMAEFGGPQENLGASMVGGVAGGWLQDKALKGTKHVAKFLSKYPKLVKGGNKAAFFYRNMPAILKDWAQDSYGRDQKWYDKIPILSDLLKSTINELPGQDNTVQTDRMEDQMKPAIFNNRVSKSITDIIPGYLARIYRELQVMRTGDESIELTEYNVLKNTWSSTSEVRKGMFADLMGKHGKTGLHEDVNDVLDMIDPADEKGNRKLNDKERKALAKQLLRDNLNGRSAPSKKKYTDFMTYEGDASEHSDKYIELFNNYYGDDESGAKHVDFGDKFRNMGRNVDVARAKIQEMVNAGQQQFLIEAGILSKDGGMIDIDKYYMLNLYDEYTPGKGEMARKGPKKKGKIKMMSPQEIAEQQVDEAKEHAAAMAAATATITPTPTAGIHVPGQDYDPVLKDILAAIKGGDSRDVQQAMAETLVRIEEELKKGLMVYQGEGEGEEANTARKRIWDRSLKEHAKGAFGFGKKLYEKARDTGQRNWRRANILRKRGFRTAGKFFDTAKEWVGDKAIYLKGQAEPILEEAKLKAGMYYDQATGQVIKNWSDIKGAIVDENGKIVVKTEDLKNLITRTSAGETAWRWGTRAVEAAKKGLNYAKNQVGIMTGMLRKGAFGVYGQAFDLAKKAWKFIDGPQDVYVWSTDEPPVLVKALDAKTMASKGYSNRTDSTEIEKPTDIKGAVYDYRGIEVITQEQFNKGIFDKDGHKLSGGIGRLLGIGKGMVSRGLQALKGLKDKALGFLGGITGIKGFGKGILDWFKTDGIVFSGSKTIVERLTQIRDLLDRKGIYAKKHVAGVDENGVRQGSYEDQEAEKDDDDTPGGPGLRARLRGLGGGLRDRARGLRDRLKGGAPDALARGKAAGAGALERIKGLKDKFKRKKKEDDDADKDTTSGVAGAVEEAAGSAALKAGKGAAKGLWKYGLKPGGKLVGNIAKFGLTRALPFIAEAGVSGLMATAGTALSVGGSVLGGAAGLAGSAAMGALGFAGATLGAVAGAIFSPVGLAIGGLALAGYGAYKAYQYFTRTTLTDLSKLRYIQYGFTQDDDKHANTIFGFESEMLKVTSMAGGIPTIDEKKMQMKDILSDFDIDKDDQEAVGKWLGWYTQRFKPVFIQHLVSLAKANPDAKLDNSIEKLKPSEKKAYISQARWPDGPYGVSSSPFKELPALATTAVEVNAYADQILKSIDEEIAKDGGDKKAAVAGAAGGVVAAGAAVADAQKDATQAQKDSKDLPGADFKQQMSKTGAIDGSLGVGISGGGAMLTMSGSFDATNVTTGARLDALACIRFKTYGLKDMEIQKVKALMSLENVLVADLKVDAKGTTTWSGDLEKVLKLMGPAFGVMGEANTKEGMSFQGWFQLRFLPTYLNYLSAIFKSTGKNRADEAMNSLKPQEALDAAQAVIGSHSNYQGNTGSVWSVTLSPWPNYSLNSDPATTKENVDGLTDAAQKTHLEETVGLAGMDKDSATNKVNDTANAGPAPETTLGRKISNVFGSVWEGIKSVGKGMVDAIAGTPGGVTPEGMPIDTSLQGTGGLAEKLPDPKGQGTWESMKDLIIAASKMVGVDPTLMGTMAAIESGFKPGIKAGTSSASGLYQFITDTWNRMIAKFGGKYGIPQGTPPTNAKANALMGAEYIKENAGILSKALKRPLTATDLYAAHFLGPGGAVQLLTANPQASAAAILPAPAAANKSIFYDGGRPRTVAEVIGVLDNLVKTKGQKFGVSVSGSQALVSDTPAQTNASGTPASGVGQAAAGPAAKTPAPGATAARQGASAGPVPETQVSGTGADLASSPQGDVSKRPSPAASQTTAGPKPSGGMQDPSPAVGATPAVTMGMGLVPNQTAPQDMAAQQQYQRSLTPGLMQNTETLLSQQLTTQQGILDAVSRILAIAQNNAAQSGASSNQPAANDASGLQRAVDAQRATPTPLPPSKVSMRKRDWSAG